MSFEIKQENIRKRLLDQSAEVADGLAVAWMLTKVLTRELLALKELRQMLLLHMDICSYYRP